MWHWQFLTFYYWYGEGNFHNCIAKITNSTIHGNNGGRLTSTDHSTGQELRQIAHPLCGFLQCWWTLFYHRNLKLSMQYNIINFLWERKFISIAAVADDISFPCKSMDVDEDVCGIPISGNAARFDGVTKFQEINSTSLESAGDHFRILHDQQQPIALHFCVMYLSNFSSWMFECIPHLHSSENTIVIITIHSSCHSVQAYEISNFPLLFTAWPTFQSSPIQCE